jgi:hypothetical protein
MATEYVDLSPPSTPASGATVVLFNSTFGSTTTNGTSPAGVARLGLTRVMVTFYSVSHDAAANGLKFYGSSNGGTSWDQIETGTSVPASVAGSTQTEDYDVAPYRDVKLEYTASANTYTTWRVGVKLVRGDRVVGS